MGEFRNTIAALGAALVALGVGLVILSEPALEPRDHRLEVVGWFLVATGVLLLAAALVGAISAMQRRRTRVRGLGVQMAEGISVRQRIMDDKPDDEAIDAAVNGWLAELQEYLRAHDHQHRLIDVQASIVESIRGGTISGFSGRGSALLIRVDHVLRTLRRYVPND